MLVPMPPLRFCTDIDAPISVRIKAANGEGKAFVVFYFKGAQSSCATQTLTCDKCVKFWHCHSFLLPTDEEEVPLGSIHDSRIELIARFDFLVAYR